MQNYFRKPLSFILLSLLVNSPETLAIDYSYSLFSTLRTSDNLAQDDQETSGQSLNSGFDFGLESDANTSWQFDFSGSLAREEFSLDRIEAQNYKRFSGELVYVAPAANFNVLIRDDFSQIPRNRFATQQVGNITDTNVLLIRPSYVYRITSIDQLIFEVTHTDTNVDNEVDNLSQDDFAQLFDSANSRSSIRFQRSLSATADISVVFENNRLNFEDNPQVSATDYDQEDVFLRWVGLGRYNQLQLEYGISKITDESEIEFSNVRNSLIFTRQINSSHELELSYSEGFYINFSQNFASNTLNIDQQGGTFGAAQEFKQRALSYTIDNDVITADLNVFNSEFRGTNTDSGETRRGLDLNFSYSLQRLFATAQATSIALSLRKSANSFYDQNVFVENSISSLGLNYIYSFNSETEINAEYVLRKADDLSPNTPFFQTDVKTFSVGITYRPNTTQRRN